jgi:hypothetical protein
VPLKKNCFNINSYNQASEIISICKKNNKVPILFIKYFLINGFGIHWLQELQRLLLTQFTSKNYKIYVDSKKNYGLFIDLVENQVNYIKVNANNETLKRLKQIAKLNKVLINPKFSIVDLSKTKNLQLKIEKNIK